MVLFSSACPGQGFCVYFARSPVSNVVATRKSCGEGFAALFRSRNVAPKSSASRASRSKKKEFPPWSCITYAKAKGRTKRIPCSYDFYNIYEVEIVELVVLSVVGVVGVVGVVEVEVGGLGVSMSSRSSRSRSRSSSSSSNSSSRRRIRSRVGRRK